MTDHAILKDSAAQIWPELRQLWVVSGDSAAREIAFGGSLSSANPPLICLKESVLPLRPLPGASETFMEAWASPYQGAAFGQSRPFA